MRGRQLLNAWIERAEFRTNRQAAQALGVNETQLWQWRYTSRRPNLTNATLLEQKAGVPTVSWLESEVGGAAETIGRRGGKPRFNKT